MEIHYCWRCNADLPFLEQREFDLISPYIGIPILIEKGSEEWRLRTQIPLDIFESLTGYRLNDRWDIFHHRRAEWGEPCTNCGRLLRTPKASFCANCGKQRSQALPPSSTGS